MEGAQVNTPKNKENWKKRLMGEGRADRDDTRYSAKIACSYSQVCPNHILARTVLFHLEKQGDYLGELKCNSDLLLLLAGAA